MALQSTWLVVEHGRTPASRVARRALRKRLDAVWSELQAAAGDRPDAERVHRLRVATRRTLAAVDAFADLLPAKPRDWFAKRLRRLRRAAGEARDLDVLTDRLEREAAGSAGAPAARSARERLVAMLSRRRAASRAPIQEIRDALLAADWHGRTERLLDDVGRIGCGSRARSSATRWRSSRPCFPPGSVPGARTLCNDSRTPLGISRTTRRRPIVSPGGRDPTASASSTGRWRRSMTWRPPRRTRPARRS
jgi:hypothetical protein